MMNKASLLKTHFKQYKQLGNLMEQKLKPELLCMEEMSPMPMWSELLFSLLYPFFTPILLQTPIYSLSALLTNADLFPPQIKTVTLRSAGEALMS